MPPQSKIPDFNDIAAGLPTFADISAGLPSFEEISTGLPDFEDYTAGMTFPEDAPTFDPKADPEVNTTIRLSDDRTHIRRPTRRLFVDYRANPDAFAHLTTLPGPGESLHGVISGKYALYELIPALIERTGQKIEHLHIATLSFNQQNAADLLGLIDDGQVKHVSLLISYYFKSTSRETYDALIPQLRQRGHRTLAMRTHCKMLLAKMEDGTAYTIESSANLRSSVNTEQFVMTNDPDLYAFHTGWIDGELLTKTDLGDD